MPLRRMISVAMEMHEVGLVHLTELTKHKITNGHLILDAAHVIGMTFSISENGGLFQSGDVSRSLIYARVCR
jgi:hypothetical protein